MANKTQDSTPCQRSRSWIILLSILILLVPIGLWGAVRFGNFKPNVEHITEALVCHQPEFNFNSVTSEQASLLKHTFTVTNVSGKRINITKVLTSCKCTKAELSKNEIAPSESVQVAVELDWRTSSGMQSATVMLKTDEGDITPGVLTVRANVVNPIVVWPHELTFIGVGPGLSPEQLFELSPAVKDLSFQVTEIRTSDPSIVVHPIKNDDSKADIPIISPQFGVSVIGSRTSSVEHSGFVLVKTSLGGTYRVRIRTSSAGAIVANPNSLLFDFSRSSANKVSDIRLQLPDSAASFEFATHATILPSDADGGLTVENVRIEHESKHGFAVVSVRCAAISDRVRVSKLHVVTGDDSLDVPIIVIGSVGTIPLPIPIPKQGFDPKESP